MTRWARAGNSQKHQKMPEDATSWEELSKHIRKSKETKKVKEKPSFTTGVPKTVKFESSTFKTINMKSEDKLNVQNSPRKRKNLIDDSRDVPIDTFQDADTDRNLPLDKPIKKQKKQDADKLEDSNDCSQSEINCDTAEKVSNISHSIAQTNNFSEKKKKKLRNKNEFKKKTANGESPNPLSKDQDGQNLSEVSDKNKSLERKEYFKKELLQKRMKNGITLLPPKDEQKLYRMRKKFREKGFPPDVIKNIIRKERRKAEIRFRNLSAKICFNCRQNGHVLSECPMPMKGANPGVGLCFKCGSLEHTSARCKKKVSGYPFATCFICKAEGHISRDCPSNTHGIYPKGGRCNLCDNINHLRKDCPSIKKKEDETAVTLQTYNDVTSIDDEVIDSGKKKLKNNSKKLKVVKF